MKFSSKFELSQKAYNMIIENRHVLSYRELQVGMNVNYQQIMAKIRTPSAGSNSLSTDCGTHSCSNYGTKIQFSTRFHTKCFISLFPRSVHQGMHALTWSRISSTYFSLLQRTSFSQSTGALHAHTSSSMRRQESGERNSISHRIIEAYMAFSLSPTIYFSFPSFKKYSSIMYFILSRVHLN